MEWALELTGLEAEELRKSLDMGQLLEDEKTFRVARFDANVAIINGTLRVEIFSNEHPPPHFRVWYNGETNNFRIDSGEPLNGNGLRTYFRNIKKWHREHKPLLISKWNERRPSDCPVGIFQEAA